MTAIEILAGRASAGTLYGIGVGPGDIRYMTLRAAGLVQSVDVLAFFAKRGSLGNARGIIAPLLMPGREELRLEYPVTDEIPPHHPSYRKQIASFYDHSMEAIAKQLRQGKSVGLLAEGDPFFYGSFMHIWRRLDTLFPIEVVPGVTGMSGAWARANAPITWGDDILTVLPGTLDETQLTRRLGETDAAVIMKVGKHLEKIRRAVTAAGLLSRAIYVVRGTMLEERIMPLSECSKGVAPYFSMVLIPGQGRRL
ncbi:precorrin-2/cobalt-factor-2 C20-methyltransferase [Nitrobacteraceae bacterium AZCC 2161]